MSVLTSSELQSVALASSVSFPAGGTGNPISLAVIADEKSATTNGGTFTHGAWRTRDLGTELCDPDSIVTLSSNQFTLGAGMYLIQWVCPAKNTTQTKSALYDVTGTAYLEYGCTAYSHQDGYADCRSIGSFVHSPTGSNAYEIRQRCTTTASTNGFGEAAGYSVVEIYTVVTIYKLK